MRRIAFSLILTALVLGGVYGRRIWNAESHESQKDRTPAAPLGTSREVPTGRMLDVTYEQFFALKIVQPPIYDLVFAGDSRVATEVSPAVVGKSLNGYRMYNFGFNALCWGDEYLDAVERLLDPKGERKTIVLGITPLALTRKNSRSSPFLMHYRMSDRKRERLLRLGRTIDALSSNVHPEGSAILSREYHDDGWIATIRKRSGSGVRKVRGKLRNFPVDPDVTAAVVQRVAAWRRAGIRVFFYRPPTSRPMRRFEDETLGFDETEFFRRMSEAGAIQLEFSEEGYFWEDGIHMDIPSAVRFSEHLAEALQRQLDGGKSS